MLPVAKSDILRLFSDNSVIVFFVDRAFPADAHVLFFVCLAAPIWVTPTFALKSAWGIYADNAITGFPKTVLECFLALLVLLALSTREKHQIEIVPVSRVLVGT